MLLAMAAIVGIVAPSALIALSMSALLGTVLPRGLARIAAVLVWLWIQFSTPLIPVPTLNGTAFNLVGDTVTAGFFDGNPIYAPDGPLSYQSEPWSAALSLVWQLALIFVLLAVGSRLAETLRQR
ncbi:hypothetical protein [Microbacterium lacticum]